MRITIEKGKWDMRSEDLLVRFAAGNTETALEAAPVGSAARFMLTMGLGEQKDLTRETVREAVGAALQEARRLKAQRVAMALPDVPGHTVAEVGAAVAESALLFGYAYTTFKAATDAKKLPDSVTVIVADERTRASVRKAVDRVIAVNDGVTLTRDLVNAPAEHVHPAELASTARAIARKSKGRITAKVLDRKECEQRGMGAYLAVAKGSEFPPQFIHLTYTPAKKSKRTVAVVGKGITFDSGGLSLKPADAMMTMKLDMAGAAAVLGLFRVLPAIAPNVTVHGIIAACENMPSGKAMRPGDVVRASNGKTIEILNTDAEGRLTLADALTYAVQLEPDAIVDLATLTGACAVALGEEIAGLMSNDDDLEDALEDAADATGEKIWELPLPARYRSLIESDVADLRNIATSRYGGTLTAGLFLKEFVDDVPWAHLDIAGPAFAERPMASYIGKGGTGFGVRTLVQWLSTFR